MTATKNSSSIAWLPWLVFAGSATFYFYEFLLRVLPNTAVNYLSDYFNIDYGHVGSLSSVYYYAYVPMQIVVGVLLDRYNVKWLLVFACFLCGIGTAMFIATDSVTIASIGRFLLGAGSAFAYVGTLKIATVWLPPHYFGLLVGLTNTLGVAGSIVADKAVSALIGETSVPYAFYVCAIMGVLLALILAIILRNAPKTKPTQTELDTTTISAGALWSILSQPRIWLIGTIGCLMYLPQTGFADLWGSTFMQEVYGLSPDQAADQVVYMLLGFMLSTTLSGKLADKFKNEKMQIIIGSVVATLAAATIIFLPDFVRSGVGLGFVMLILGLAFGAQVLVFVLATQSVSANLAATALAVTNMIIMLGGIIFQPLIGYLIDFFIAKSFSHAEAFQYAMLVLPIGLSLSVVLGFCLKPRVAIETMKKTS